MEYTFKRFKELRPEYLTNAMIAEIIGTTENNVQVQLRPNKKLPTWARVFMYMWLRNQNSLIEVPKCSADDFKCFLGIVKRNEDFAKGAKGIQTDFNPKSEQWVQTCGCYIDETGLFRRGKDKCKLQKNVHKFT